MRAPSTPSSLKWLIDRRTRIAGEIEKVGKQEAERLLQVKRIIEKAQAVVKKLEDENATASRLHDKHVQAITQALAATDLLLREHEIPIDPWIYNINQSKILSAPPHCQDSIGANNLARSDADISHIGTGAIHIIK